VTGAPEPVTPEPVTPEPVTPEPPPDAVRRAVMTQDWATVTYLHWPYDPAVVAPLLPRGVRPDVLTGAAWVGLVPFHMRRVRLLGTPPLPHVSDFLETNVRTYTVGPDGRRGVFFLTLEADRLLPVLAARASYRLPYTWARMSLSTEGDVVTYRSVRRWPGPTGAASLVRVRVGDPVVASPLEDALTARWALHSTWWGGGTVRATVAHGRWPLRAAELLDVDTSLVAAVGLPGPQGVPSVLHSPGVAVRIGLPRPVPTPPAKHSTTRTGTASLPP